MAVVLTEKAADEVKRILEDQKHESETKLRIGINAGGCSGFEYSLALTQEFDDDQDNEYEYHGIHVVVNKKHALYLDGTTVDFYDGLDRRGFAFNNPNASRSCGCGKSFQA